MKWVGPYERKPITAIFHVGCTFYAGDKQSHKWSFGFNSAFYDKNRSRSNKLSYILCQHQNIGLFELNDEEMEKALI